MPRFPLVAMGTGYWAPLLEFAQESMLAEGTISPDELDYFVTDDPAEAVAQMGDLA